MDWSNTFPELAPRIILSEHTQRLVAQMIVMTAGVTLTEVDLGNFANDPPVRVCRENEGWSLDPLLFAFKSLMTIHSKI